MIRPAIMKYSPRARKLVLFVSVVGLVWIGFLAGFFLTKAGYGGGEYGLVRRGSYPLSEMINNAGDTSTPDGTVVAVLVALSKRDARTYNRLTTPQSRQGFGLYTSHPQPDLQMKDLSAYAQALLSDTEARVKWGDASSNEIGVLIQDSSRVGTKSGDIYVLHRVGSQWIITDMYAPVSS